MSKIEKPNINENRIEKAMSIILNSGDARNACIDAMEAISEYHFDEAKKLMQIAKEKMSIAHAAQTDAIQDECRGVKTEYSLLFAHAQDTMMSIQSEIIIVSNLMKYFESLNMRITKLEKEIVK